MISTGIKKVLTGDKTKSQKDYLTTTELARICGVSRFTIINWVKKGKIKSFETIGGHRRIAFSEVILFLEALHIDSAKNGGPSERKQIEKPSDEKIDISKEIAEEKRNFLYSFVYGVGRVVHGLEETVADLRERFVGRPYRVNRQTEET